MGKRIIMIALLVLLVVSVVVEAYVWDRRDGQVGWASWYGKRYHGRKTASGERFSMGQLTAAHRSLPLGTKALVTNLETGQQVEVTINDRGPFVDPERRIIDLSRAAAERLGLVQRGVGRVQVVAIEEIRIQPDTATTPAAKSTSATRARLADEERTRKPAGEAPAAWRTAQRPRLVDERRTEKAAGEEAAAWRTAQRPDANRAGERSSIESVPVIPSTAPGLDCRAAPVYCLTGG
jgi:rare lipoprotein A